MNGYRSLRDALIAAIAFGNVSRYGADAHTEATSFVASCEDDELPGLYSLVGISHVVAEDKSLPSWAASPEGHVIGCKADGTPDVWAVRWMFGYARETFSDDDVSFAGLV